jgi:hypothetical protein
MEEAYTEDLKKIPYIDNVPSDGRSVGLYPYFDETKKAFITHVPKGDGKLIWIFAEPVEAPYWAKSK